MAYYDRYGRIDRRKFNGGARPGAGRPRSLKRQQQDAFMLNFMMEKILVREFRHGQMRWVKETRLQVQMDALYKKAVGGKGNVRAIRMFLDLALGKAEKPKPEKVEKERRDAFYLEQQIRDRLAVDDYMEATFVVPPPPLPPAKPPLERIKLLVDKWENEKRLKERKKRDRAERKRIKELAKYNRDFFFDKEGRKVMTERGTIRGTMKALERREREGR